MWFLRLLFDSFFVLLLGNGIGISYGDIDLLYINGFVFRYCFLCDCLYLFFSFIGRNFISIFNLEKWSCFDE